MKVLLVHEASLATLGGAELSLSEHVLGAPAGVQVTVIRPDQDVELSDYDAVVVANIRPRGGVGEQAELAPALKWARRLKEFNGFALRSERDVHPCTYRDARCIQGRRLRYVGCDCSSLMREAFAALYAQCDVVQFLSPAHRRVVRQLISVPIRQVVIAPPIDLSRFVSVTPIRDREAKALILGDDIRIAATAEQRARSAGLEPHRVPYLSVAYEEMPALYNRYQAVVVDPVMFHAFGRIAVEAQACGCRVLASERVGAMSWWRPQRACRKANAQFWRVVTKGVAKYSENGA